MADLNMTESEEMYLITLAKLAERGVAGPVPLTMLAGELAVLPVSANQMVHKLQGEGVLDYLPYKGVALRPEGLRRANRTLRRRRLWELFLVERLGMGFDEADTLACRLEHLGTDAVAEQLATFLGDPKVSSQGLPIPPAEEIQDAEEPLSQKKAGHVYEVTQIAEGTLRSFLAAQGIGECTQLKLLASSSRGDVMVDVQGTRLHLAAKAAGSLLVKESAE
ncbi:MAG TPA: metal-dependent transcriptional regulator [Anaerolineales bacterium]